MKDWDQGFWVKHRKIDVVDYGKLTEEPIERGACIVEALLSEQLCDSNSGKVPVPAMHITCEPFNLKPTSALPK
jgi:hypothetical protein